MLAAERMDARDVMDGTLGCPICRAEFRIAGGVARFEEDSPAAATLMQAPDEDEALRLAALLDLTDARGYAIVQGELGNHAPRLCELTDVQLMLVDPPPGIAMGSGLSGITTSATSHALPLAAASARGIALPTTATPKSLIAALAVLAPAGRLLAPVRLPLPDGVTELARDERQWLGARERAPSASGIVRLDRRQ